MQILASVTNTSIVRDPLGYIGPGTMVRIPFLLNEADINCRVVLLTDFPVVKLMVETPDGKVIDPGNAASFGVTFDTATAVRTARFNLPLAFSATKLHAGTWHALLEVDRNLLKRLLSDKDKANQPQFADLLSKGAKYCVSIHSFSNLRMNATISQTGFVPGSTLFLRAALTEYGVPVEHRAAVTAELEYPDKSRTIVTLTEDGPGVFGASVLALQAGIYRFHVLAQGGTFRGVPFTREQLVNAAVWHGDGRPDQPLRGDTDKDDWCQLLTCLLGKKALSHELEERLRKEGIDLDSIRHCISAFCKNRKPTLLG